MVSRHKKKRREVKGGNSPRGKDGPGYYPYHPDTVLEVEFWPEFESFGTCLQEEKEIGHQHSGGVMKLTVVKTFSRTLSCVLLGSVDIGGLDETLRAVFVADHTCNDGHESRKEIKVVLKLYDRRFSDGIREDYGAAQWTPKMEADRRRFEELNEQDKPEVCVEGENDSWLYRSSGEEEENNNKDGDGRKFELRVVDMGKQRPKSNRKKNRTKMKAGNLTNKGTNGSVNRQQGQTASAQQKISPSKWTAGHREVYMQKVCDRNFSTELSVYLHGRPVQGKSIPFVYGTVRLRIGDGNRGIGDRVGNYVNGLIMEYIQPSFTLRDIPENVPDTGMWQELGEVAVKLVQGVGDYGILHEDVRLDNILVVPVKEGYYEEREDEEDSNNGLDNSRKLRFFKAVMIDFGLARARREDEADEDWKKARYFRDEEGAVGYVLENFLRTAAGSEWEARPFKFRHSHRLGLQLDYEI